MVIVFNITNGGTNKSIEEWVVLSRRWWLWLVQNHDLDMLCRHRTFVVGDVVAVACVLAEADVDVVADTTIDFVVADDDAAVIQSTAVIVQLTLAVT
jgi:hypothetical protein